MTNITQVKRFLADIEEEHDEPLYFMGQAVDERFTRRELITILKQYDFLSTFHVVRTRRGKNDGKEV